MPVGYGIGIGLLQNLPWLGLKLGGGEGVGPGMGFDDAETASWWDSDIGQNPNLLIQSEEITDSAWVQTGTGTEVQNADGSFDLTDSDAAALTNWVQTVPIEAGSHLLAVIQVKKDAAPAVYPTVQIELTGGTGTENFFFQINPADGAFAIQGGNGTVTVTSVGDYWRYEVINENAKANDSGGLKIFPAGATSFPSAGSATVQGTTTFRFPLLTQSDNYNELLETERLDSGNPPWVMLNGTVERVSGPEFLVTDNSGSGHGSLFQVGTAAPADSPVSASIEIKKHLIDPGYVGAFILAVQPPGAAEPLYNLLFDYWTGEVRNDNPFSPATGSAPFDQIEVEDLGDWWLITVYGATTGPGATECRFNFQPAVAPTLLGPIDNETLGSATIRYPNMEFTANVRPYVANGAALDGVPSEPPRYHGTDRHAAVLVDGLPIREGLKSGSNLSYQSENMDTSPWQVLSNTTIAHMGLDVWEIHPTVGGGFYGHQGERLGDHDHTFSIEARLKGARITDARIAIYSSAFAEIGGVNFRPTSQWVRTKITVLVPESSAQIYCAITPSVAGSEDIEVRRPLITRTEQVIYENLILFSERIDQSPWSGVNIDVADLGAGAFSIQNTVGFRLWSQPVIPEAGQDYVFSVEMRKHKGGDAPAAGLAYLEAGSPQVSDNFPLTDSWVRHSLAFTEAGEADPSFGITPEFATSALRTIEVRYPILHRATSPQAKYGRTYAEPKLFVLPWYSKSYEQPVGQIDRWVDSTLPSGQHDFVRSSPHNGQPFVEMGVSGVDASDFNLHGWAASFATEFIEAGDAGDYNFMHDGTGMELTMAIIGGTDAVVEFLLATARIAGQSGFQLVLSAANGVEFVVFDGTTSASRFTAAQTVPTAGAVIQVSYRHADTPKTHIWVDGVDLALSGADVVTPSVADHVEELTMGGKPGATSSDYFKGKVLFAAVQEGFLSDDERSSVMQYARSKITTFVG